MCARQTWSTLPQMTRETRACVSPMRCSPVPLPAAKDARSARTASIWPMAARVPSIMPMAVSFSSSSRELNEVTVVTRDPGASSVPVSVNSKSMVMVGMMALAVPLSSSAKPSRTMNRCGASTETHSQNPGLWSPSGPVMK